MIVSNQQLKPDIYTSQYRQTHPLFKEKDKVVFQMLPFLGFNDDIPYLKVQERAPSLNSEENYVNDQMITNSKYKIENLQNHLEIDNKTNFMSADSINDDTNFSDDFIPNHVDNDNVNIHIQDTSSSDENKEILSSKPLKKCRVHLNEQALMFKENFYQLFTFKKKFQKRYVVQIHNIICRQLGLRKVNREESRSIDKYFQHFAPYSDRILKCIKITPISVWPSLIPSLFNITNVEN